MTTGPTEAVSGRRAERDRFVALAFCWGDLLLELDGEARIVFAADPTEAVLGKPPGQLAGTPFQDVVDTGDRSLVRWLLDIAKKQGRFDIATIRFTGPHGATPPLAFAGYHLKELAGHYFLACRLGSHAPSFTAGGQPLKRDEASGLMDAESFTSVIGEALKDAGDDCEMTLISLPGLEDLKEKMDEDTERSFEGALGTSLRAGSLNGDAAAKVSEDRYVVLHGGQMEALVLRDQIADLARDADPEGEGLTVETASVAVDKDEISPADMANGLIYTINRFRNAKGSDFDMRSLSTSMSALVSEAVQSVQTFKDLVARRDFQINFQPIINVQTGDIHHYEALCRFPNARDGESPYQYITFAEETGLISEFDLAMAAKVVDWLNARPRGARDAAAVNLSGHSVASLSYVAGLHGLLQGNGHLKRRLAFEITESARMDDLNAANHFILGLRNQGFEVCLDDFGAGAANFQYLSTLEVDVVKLDGSAVRNAQRAAKGEAFLKALVSLCHNLKVDTIAEMIDDRKGLSFVRSCGVDYVQGYLFGKPSPNVADFDNSRPAELFPQKRRR